MTPVLVLLLTAPLVAEFLLGDVTLASLPALVVFIPLYGGGAVLIREVLRRRGGGWPAMVVLAAAFGVIEEGLALYLGGMVYVLSLHVIWSICTPIALVESMFLSRRTEPWLLTPGLIIIAAREPLP
jgi:hypothetical protein